jgi:hypothetical protein
MKQRLRFGVNRIGEPAAQQSPDTWRKFLPGTVKKIARLPLLDKPRLACRLSLISRRKP